MPSFRQTGQLVDLHQRRIYPAEINIVEGRIASISELSDAPEHYIMPGFIDAHVHIESSMLVPAEFARLAVVHGTVATVSDPHEIANVCGLEGIHFMIRNAKATPFKCFFGAPSCVPATSFETAGAVIDSGAIDTLLAANDIWYLTEMMNYPGVLHNDEEVMAKIAAAKRHLKPIDGHAPGLRGDVAIKYAAAGISTDHECTTLDEATDKIKAGMQILIREGSAAKNYEALHTLLDTHPDRVMFCSDDKHPDDLVEGHINEMVKRALLDGHDLFSVLYAACVHPVIHYGLPVGLLRVGDAADFIVLSDLEQWKPKQTYIGGALVASDNVCHFIAPEFTPINRFRARPRMPADFGVVGTSDNCRVRVIEAYDGQLTTTEGRATLPCRNGNIMTDIDQDVIKLVVLNRYETSADPAIAFVRNFGLRKGAIASTVAHDCHNIIAAGVDDESICIAINAIINTKGGIAVVTTASEVEILDLPVAGLMCKGNGHEIGKRYAVLSNSAKKLGSKLNAPFMTLSFMALLVIPALKLSDKGLFNGGQFRFSPIFPQD